MPEIVGLLVRILNFILWIAPTAFWIWMLIDCFKNEDERYWIFIIFFTFWIGALIYLFARKIPRGRGSGGPSRLFAGLSRRKEIQEAEAAAKSIGNAYHFVQWGDLLNETGQYRKAAEVFRQGLEKDPENLDALWGLGFARMEMHDYESARGPLAKIIEKDRTFKFGTASLTYARCLHKLGNKEAARKQFEKHLEKYTHAEAFVTLAELLIENGEYSRARQLLERVINDLKAAPKFNVRKQRKWANRARAMLTGLNLRGH